MSFPYNHRDFDGMTPSIAHPGGKNAARALAALLNQQQGGQGEATIASGSDNVVIAFDRDFDGLPVLVSLTGAADGTLTSIVSTAWDGSGNLTITGNANATADKTLAYQVLVPQAD